MSVTMKTLGQLKYLVAEEISVPHCFTTRAGGVSQGVFAGLNLGAGRGDSLENVEKNYDLLGQALGFSRQDLVLTRQIHGDTVRRVDRSDSGMGVDHNVYPACDALITHTPGVARTVFTADCTPILLWDPVTAAVGAVHAGWRGTALGIVKKTVEAMQEAYGVKPGDLRCAIGPNIASCCFETDRDVADSLVGALGGEAEPYLHPKGNKFYPDLKQINGLWLKKAGVGCVAISDLCTACHPELFWSHRKMGAQRGSQGAIILCKEGQL